MSDGRWKIGGENLLRRWVARASDGRARWVEHAAGGTLGHPDCWVVPVGGRPGQVVFTELKIGQVKGGELIYEVRPDQKGCLRGIVGDGCLVGLIVGIAGCYEVGFGLVNEENLSGRVEALGLMEGDSWWVGDSRRRQDFWGGINFIIGGGGSA